MAKQPAKQPSEHSWTIYRIAAKRKDVGRVNAPDEKTAIARAIEEYQVPPNERLKLITLRGIESKEPPVGLGMGDKPGARAAPTVGTADGHRGDNAPSSA